MAGTTTDKIEHSGRKLSKAFQKVTEDSYKELMRDFKKSLNEGKDTLWWQCPINPGMNEEFHEMVCRWMASKAKAEGYHTKFKKCAAYPQAQLYVIISTKKIDVYDEENDEIIANILVLLAIVIIVIFIASCIMAHGKI